MTLRCPCYRCNAPRNVYNRGCGSARDMTQRDRGTRGMMRKAWCTRRIARRGRESKLSVHGFVLRRRRTERGAGSRSSRGRSERRQRSFEHHRVHILPIHLHVRILIHTHVLWRQGTIIRSGAEHVLVGFTIDLVEGGLLAVVFSVLALADIGPIGIAMIDWNPIRI